MASIARPALPAEPEDLVCRLMSDASSFAARFPLMGVFVDIKVWEMIAEVELTLRFVNNTDQDEPETVFTFEQDQTTICGFEARVGSKQLVGSVRPKVYASAIYVDAVNRGEKAALAEMGVSESCARVAIGNIPAHTEALIRLTYVEELRCSVDNQGPFTSLFVPVTAAAVPYTDDPFASGDRDCPTGVHIQANVHMIGGVTSLHSRTHSLQWADFGSYAVASCADNGAFDGGRARFHLDISLPVVPENKVTFEAPTSDLDCYAAMLSVIPRLPGSTEDSPAEFVFIIDRSGSMEGVKMTQACNALQLFLRGIPEGSSFNIISFGTQAQPLFPASVPYSATNLNLATETTRIMRADLGGTNLLNPLRLALGEAPQNGLRRFVFVLTDGAVDDTAGTIQYVASARHPLIRVMALGIGSGADRPLVKGVAAQGGGTAEFTADGERVEAAVMKQLRHAMQPTVSEVTIDWGDFAGEGALQSPNPLPALYHETPFTVYRIFGKDVPAKKGTVTVRGRFNNADFAIPATLDLTGDHHTPAGSRMVHRLATKCVVRDYEARRNHDEEDEPLQTRLVQMAIEHNLCTSLTSFVATEKPVVSVEEFCMPPEPISANKPHRSVLKAAKDWADALAGAKAAGAGQKHMAALEHILDNATGMPTPPTHPTRLLLANDLGDTLMKAGHMTEAAWLMKKAFDDSISELDCLSEDSYKDSTLTMQLLRDKLTLMTGGADAGALPSDDATEAAPGQGEADGGAAAAAAYTYQAPTIVIPQTHSARAASSVAPAPAQPTTRVLDRFVILQQVNGLWLLDDAVAGLLNKGSEADLLQAMPAPIQGEQVSDADRRSAWATVLVLAYFQKYLQMQQPEWLMLYEKATKKLNKLCPLTLPAFTTAANALI